MADRPTDATAPVRDLGARSKAQRESYGLSLRQASAEIGVSFNTLARVERGHLPDLQNYQRIVRWLGLAGDEVQPESTPDTVARHLKTDPALPPDAAKRIADIVNDLYKALARPPTDTPFHLRASRTFTPDAATRLADLLEGLKTALEAEKQ